jgi:ATP-binding protein involved in chromosome partitioning
MIYMKSYHDIVGDGGADIAKQVTERRAKIADRLSGVRSIVAIGSGKGGVGKSTLTMQLASALRVRGQRVAILDADLDGPAQARLGGVQGAPLVPAEDGLAMPSTAEGVGVVSLGALVPEPQAVDFDSVAQGEAHTWRATREFSALAELLTAVSWGRLDFLLVDLPPGAGRARQYAEFLGPETAFVLVTIPTELARGVVARTISALRETPNRLLGYVENMQGYYCSDCASVKPLFPALDPLDLGIPCLGRVPFDPRLAALCDAGKAIAEHPQLACAWTVRDVAERLLEAGEASA